MRKWSSIALAVSLVGATAARAGEPEFEQVNLVSDNGAPGTKIDLNLVNPWGIARSPDPTPPSEWWVANNGSNTATLYLGDGTAESLIVATPVDPSGQVFYGGDKLIVSDDKGNTGPARFIFAAESGTISAWSPTVPPPPPSKQALVMFDGSADNDVFKGLAIATDYKGRTRLYTTDFHNGRVIVLDDAFNEVHLGRSAFRDRELPRHYAPFGIAAFGSRLFVTYAVQDADAGDDVAGPGHGIIDEYDLDGDFVRRVASHGPLDSPWGLAMGPKSWGRFEGALLVGNFGDGKIHAYRQLGHDFVFEGTITTGRHQPLVIPGLWSLMPGNDGQAGSSQNMYFTAGPDDESHGLFGFIQRRP